MPLVQYFGGEEMIDHREIVWESFTKIVIKPESTKLLLDIGCRDRYMQDRCHDLNFEWYGTDIIPSNDPRIKTLKMEDMKEISDNTFDQVFCSHAFEHCERPIDALLEMKRILKTGGKLFMATPFPNEHHILESDEDHIFCMTAIQAERLLRYTEWSKHCVWTQKSFEGSPIKKEQDYNIIWEATK